MDWTTQHNGLCKMEYGMWSIEYGIWGNQNGISNLGYGTWDIGDGKWEISNIIIFDMEYGSCHPRLPTHHSGPPQASEPPHPDL